MDNKMAGKIAPWMTCVKMYRFNWRASMFTTKPVWDLIWSGPVQQISEDITNNRMTVTSVGWLERLNRRIIRENLNYVYTPGSNPPSTATGTEDAAIIFDLLDRMNAPYGPDGYPIRKPPGWSTATGLVRGNRLPNEGPGGMTAYTPAMRGKNIAKGQKILPVYNELMEVENGCDIRVDPLTRELNVYRKASTVRKKVIFSLGFGANNLQQLTREIDPSTQTNYELVTGFSGTTPQYADDVDSQLTFGLLEDTEQLSDVKKNETLLAYAGGEVIVRSSPTLIHSITPFPYTPKSGVPEPFVDYTWGDVGFLTAKLPPRVDIRGLGVRVFGITVGIDDEGNEKLGQLQLSPGA